MAPWRQVLEAATVIRPAIIVLSVGLMLGNMWTGAFRWRALMMAYGSKSMPNLAFLARAYWVGTFYNTLLPANVGGDVVRGHVTRNAFPESAAAPYVIVIVERFFGLSGLILVVLLVLSVHPVGQVSVPPTLAVMALLVAVCAAVGPSIAARFGGRLGGRVGRALAGLPRPEKPAWFGVALGLSLVTHSVASVVNWLILRELDPSVSLLDIMVLMPLALGVIYVPVTIAGLGVREAAFVVLLGEIGVSPVDATVCSLTYLGVLVTMAAGGGVSHLIWPLSYPLTPDLEIPADP